MAREILFKAKRTDNGEWVEGYLVKCRTSEEEGYAIKDTVYHVNDGIINLIPCVVDESTICQYTGLTDKNGNKIWENDVLFQKTTEKHWCQWECMGVVKYGVHDWNELDYGYTSIRFFVEPIVKKGDKNKIVCGLNQIDVNDEFYPIEVIGNIFDNPELLGGADNG